ncbi:MAG: hypothetical protein LBR73_06430 [Oscillospiraceae bacterium]|jgi:uncharacterized protein involved in cysteine biosynthesis|nr:hypothetical protein [Oscillospiraceae bacterium]
MQEHWKKILKTLIIGLLVAILTVQAVAFSADAVSAAGTLEEWQSSLPDWLQWAAGLHPAVQWILIVVCFGWIWLF